MAMGKQAFKKFGWLIKNFSSLQSEKWYSPPVLISDCKWRLLAYPKGEYLSLYLEVADFESMPFGWGRYVTFRLTLVNHYDEYRSIVEDTKRCFDCKSTVWGFEKMISLSELHLKDDGFVVNGEVMIFAELDCFKVVGTLDPSEKSEEASEILCKENKNDTAESNDLLKKTSPVKERIDSNGTKQESFIASMEKQIGNKFSWVIKNFSFSPFEMCFSDTFVIGGFNWYLGLQCDYVDLCLGICIDKSQSLPSEVLKVGLKIVNQLSEKLSYLLVSEHCFEENHVCGFEIPYGYFAANPGYLVNGELMIVAEVTGASDVFEKSIPLRKINVNGFYVVSSQALNVRYIFEKHPDIAVEFHVKNQHLRNTVMNFLLNIIETLCQSVEELSSEDLVEVDSALTYVKDAGFKVEWLEEMLEQVKETKEIERSCEARVQEMETQLHELKHKFEEEKEELSAARNPLSFEDVV